ncbi:hypothetical protein BHM03_00053190 [Ensete ventricosum]|nr:hypothetical protein BHM03_00053190 [Ensete ventricosum]
MILHLSFIVSKEIHLLFDIFLLDTGIASEKEWGINLLDEKVNESGTNEDGSTWYRESGEELGDNGYRCRWAKMGGQSYDGSSEWKETFRQYLNSKAYMFFKKSLMHLLSFLGLLDSGGRKVIGLDTKS